MSLGNVYNLNPDQLEALKRELRAAIEEFLAKRMAEVRQSHPPCRYPLQMTTSELAAIKNVRPDTIRRTWKKRGYDLLGRRARGHMVFCGRSVERADQREGRLS
ncbi:MAG: hypothetical protein AAF546_00090 [Verrucomicrobiota bacterium]